MSGDDVQESVAFFTHQGRVKRVALGEFDNVRASGLVAIRLGKHDSLGWVALTDDEDLIIVTQRGQALRFVGKSVRQMGRSASGVIAIKLAPEDRVCSAAVVSPEADLLVVTKTGYGKRTPLSEFATKGRGGKGVRCLGGELEQTGGISAARVVWPDDEVIVVSTSGMVLRTQASEIPQMGRATRGARVMDLKKGDQVSSVAVVSSRERSEG